MQDAEVFGFKFSKIEGTGNYQLHQSLPSDDEYDDHTVVLSKYEVIILAELLKEAAEE